ncbi:hypothetical protein [Sphingosinicella microcystinivorans]|uniref:hypothetical protein n=1 Tax=Sphingosinicella microcystinivorans TaxID=335406 RepID=UPI0022F3B99C|nr:hypothetical protein [Sphingosinicella microcystinivorans]WBX85615.1 hypothetical protein PE061_06790 [Sphingosinicella microcystinivorans]
MNTPSAESAAAPQYAAFVEPGGDSLHAHGAAFGTGGHVKDHADDAGLGLIDHQHFLVLVASPLDDFDAIAIGWP